VLCTEHRLVQRYLMERSKHCFGRLLWTCTLDQRWRELLHFMRSFAAKGPSRTVRECESGARPWWRIYPQLFLPPHARQIPRRKSSPGPTRTDMSGRPIDTRSGSSRIFIRVRVCLRRSRKTRRFVKPDGVVSTHRDYSIDLIGPGESCQATIALQGAGVPIYINERAELGFEVSPLPLCPVIDARLRGPKR